MDVIYKKLPLFIIAMICLVGCASKTALIYEHPKTDIQTTSELIIAVSHPIDERQPNEKVDKMWVDDPAKDIEKVISAELKSTGLFKEIVTVSLGDDTKLHDVDINLSSSIKELAWEIPNLEEQEGKMLGISILTGGIGGLIYGSGDTDFYGKARLEIAIKENKTNVTLFNKEYISRVEEKMARLKTDSYEERSKIIAKAVKRIMEEFKTDLQEIIK